MTFQCLVIQRVKSVMNTVTDKKSVTLLCHIETDEVVLSTNYFMQITYMLNRVFQRVEQLISPSETTCFFPGGTPCFTWGNKEFHQTGSFVPLKNEEDKEYSFREPDDKR